VGIRGTIYRMSTSLFSTENLLQIPLFSSMKPDVLRRMMDTMNKHEFEAGELMCREGDQGESFFIILDGEIEIIKALGTPEEQLLELAGAGDFFGEMSLFQTEGVRAASVRACTAVFALEMTRPHFDRLIHTAPEIAIEVARVLSLRVRESNNFLQEKNERLEKALRELRAAQQELIIKERMERELEVARTIQQDILPQVLPAYTGYDFGARMIPAREVGGDFFDFIPLSDHRTAVVIGDVSDKGVPAAIFMALTRSLVHAEARRSADPAVVMSRVNRLSLEMSNAAMFVTVLYGILDCTTNIFEYARAGHELPLIVTTDRRELEIPHDRGQPLALFDEPVFDTNQIKLPAGSTLLAYTDGATDVTDPDGNFFGLERLRHFMLNDPLDIAQATCDRLVAAILAHKGDSPQYDDVTLVAIRAHDNRNA
jgi:sigma-B regulation protein RsbU (phosphoserine phosphatase)